jgi:hypothetical protein
MPSTTDEKEAREYIRSTETRVTQPLEYERAVAKRRIAIARVSGRSRDGAGGCVTSLHMLCFGSDRELESVLLALHNLLGAAWKLCKENFNRDIAVKW